MDPETHLARTEVQLSLVWCAANPDLADRSLQRFLRDYGGPACRLKFDFSRAGFLTLSADFTEART